MADFQDIGITGLPTRFPVIPPWPEPRHEFWRIARHVIIEWVLVCDNCNEEHDYESSEHDLDLLIEAESEEEALKKFKWECLPNEPPDIKRTEWGHSWERADVTLQPLDYEEDEPEELIMRYELKAPELW